MNVFHHLHRINELFQNPQPFRFYDVQHLGALVLGLILAGWLIFSARKCSDKLTRIQSWLVAAVLFAIFPLNVWIYPQMGFQRPLPMHLCDWAAITSGVALITRRQTFIEITYFWALAGGINALMTPDVHEGFPHPRFVVFFVHHIGIVVVALWLTIGMGNFPRKFSVWRAFGWIQLFVVAALITNYFTKHNYGFLAFRPNVANPLLDIIGSWSRPWYILALELITLVFFSILNIPWFFVRKYQKNRSNS